MALASEKKKKDIIVQKTLDGSWASKLVGKDSSVGGMKEWGAQERCRNRNGGRWEF